MDRAQLAELLTAADDDERQTLLTRHVELADVNLAWSLKALYDNVESSDPARAAQVAVALSALTKLTHDTQVSAVAGWTEGMVALDNGQMETAIAHLQAAETQFLEVGQPVWAAATQVSELRALAILGRFDEALDCGLKARDVFVAHNDMLAAGKIEQNLGNIHFLRDRYVDAEQLYRAARERYAVVDDQKQLAQIDNCLATALTSQHRFREAGMIYEQALARAEAAGLEITLAEIEANQGSLALFQGHFDRALDYLERSRRRYAALGLAPRSAVADQELADAYLELNLAPEAAAIYERVVPIFSELGMQAEQARALAYHGRACLMLGQISAARPLLAEARVSYQEASNAVGEAMVTLFEAQAHYTEGDYAAAAAAAAQAEAPFAEAHAWGRRLLARWLRGEAARAQGQLQVADKVLKDALYDAERWLVLPVIQRCFTSLGLLAESRGDVPSAEYAFKGAIASIEETRAPLPAEEFRTAFLADKLIPYTELVRLCLAEGGPSRVAEALGYVERARSRALVDMLSGALPVSPKPRDGFESELFTRLETLREELNWFYTQIHRPDSEAASRGAALMNAFHEAVREREAAVSEITLQLRQRHAGAPTPAERFDLDSLVSDLGQETALVEYFSLDGELLAFVVTDEGIEVVSLPDTEDDVEAGLRQFHFQLGALRHSADYLRTHLPELTARARLHLCRLYDGLLRPIEGRLGERRLLVIPHRSLHYVPFHALCDGSGYMIERREVCCAPSAAVLRHCLGAPRQPLQRAALFGISDERNPRVHDEVLALKSLFPEAVARLDERATRVSLFEHAATAHVLHLACHGRFRPDNPLFSSLQLADGWLTVRDAYGLNLKCELVTLSACETGVSALAPGDEWIGLARGFFSAGAPALLVSLWTVDDDATASLMIEFYSRLQAGARPAAALRHAQCRLLEDKPHPYFWAPFVLLGRW
jgi:CHAT domain-containing protein/tetratricopeptide (TPR) repeat protein